eukprot:Gb_14293 [translate_table: standard]
MVFRFIFADLQVYASELPGVVGNACNGLTPTVALQLAAVVYGQICFLCHWKTWKAASRFVANGAPLLKIYVTGDISPKCWCVDEGLPVLREVNSGKPHGLFKKNERMAVDEQTVVWWLLKKMLKNSMKSSRGLLSPAVTLNSVPFEHYEMLEDSVEVAAMEMQRFGGELEVMLQRPNANAPDPIDRQEHESADPTRKFEQSRGCGGVQAIQILFSN